MAMEADGPKGPKGLALASRPLALFLPGPRPPARPLRRSVVATGVCTAMSGRAPGGPWSVWLLGLCLLVSLALALPLALLRRRLPRLSIWPTKLSISTSGRTTTCRPWLSCWLWPPLPFGFWPASGFGSFGSFSLSLRFVSWLLPLALGLVPWAPRNGYS